MKNITYFERTGKIYGVATESMERGLWQHTGYVFDSFEAAEKWFYGETGDEHRQLMSKTAAEKLCGKGYFEDKAKCCMGVKSGVKSLRPRREKRAKW